MSVRRRSASAHAALAALICLGSGPLTPASPALGQSGNFGTSTAVSGSTLFIGQPANFYGPGAVYGFRAGEDGGWTEVARLFAPDSVLGDAFGRSLATWESRLLVGAPGSARPGSVHLFVRSEGPEASWLDPVSVRAPDGPTHDRFGQAVALGVDVAFIGDPGADGSGLVHVAEVSAHGIRIVSTLRPEGLSDPAGAGFGSALSLDGDVLVVGAPGTDSGHGAAVVFRRQADGGWAEEAVLSGTDLDAPNQGLLGSTVVVDGNRVALGAPRGGDRSGAVLLYERGADGWGLTAELTPEDAGPGAGFGAGLATNGGEIWVGAPGAGGGDGLVYRYRADGDRGWEPAGRIAADSANTAAWPFGFGLSITAQESVAVVGMPIRDFGEGRAAILSRSGEDVWDEVATVHGEIATAVSSIEEGADCEDGSVQIFDCNNIEVVSFTPVSQLGGARGVWVNDVWGWTDPETSRDYALVSRRDGAAFVDLTDPASPRLIGSLPRTSGSRPSVWRDIKVIGNHAYIVSDGAGAHGMQVFDLTRLRSVAETPVTFEEDAHYDGIFSAHNVVADTASGFLYIVGSNGGGETCGGGLHIVDVRQPEEPAFAGCYNDPIGANSRGYTHDAHCVVYRGPDERYQGRQICVAANEVEINIADLTDKSDPVPIGRSSYPNVGYAHQGWLDEDHRYFYLGDEGDEVAGLVDRTRTLVWDLTELDDPVLVKEYLGPVAASDHNLFIRGDRAYMSNYGSGLRVLDISDRENPYEVAFFDSAPVGNNEPGMSSAASGAWSNYPFFESGLVVFTSVREGLFVVRVKPRTLIP